MTTTDLAPALARLFRELVEGAHHPRGNFVLNSGDAGLLASLDALTATEASHAVAGGGTVAAHAQHVRYGLSLMNRWAREGGNPFADATWDAAWRTHLVDDATWREIRDGLRDETSQWKAALGAPRELNPLELCGVISSIAHVAYHLGAIRQVAVATRGPRQGTFHPQP
jgi:hypothetical protein